MDNRHILFLDSGVGGLPYCRDFISRNPYETVYYLADRENFPYGPRKKDEIADILVSLTDKLLKKLNPKMVVIACNTASVAALESLRKKFPQLPFVGTVPAIKPAAKSCQKGRIGLLATERTIQDIYDKENPTALAKRLDAVGDNCEIIGIAAPELVEFIEQRIDITSRKDKTEIVKYYLDFFSSENIDTLVLGCTHFLYLLDEFKCEGKHANIKIFDSLEGIIKRIEFLLSENNSALRAIAEKESKIVRRLILTGTQMPEQIWQNKAQDLNFDLCLLDNIM